MNIFLLNIPFAIIGIAIAIVPLIVGSRHQARSRSADVTASHADVFSSTSSHEELELVA